ncbi:MAG: hypothetical protein JJU40_11315 [Rhodobacteraceae bacterium]|nr:hypothetical protein [Paracoccaceae bacterium]
MGRDDTGPALARRAAAAVRTLVKDFAGRDLPPVAQAALRAEAEASTLLFRAAFVLGPAPEVATRQPDRHEAFEAALKTLSATVATSLDHGRETSRSRRDALMSVDHDIAEVMRFLVADWLGVHSRSREVIRRFSEANADALRRLAER